MPPDAYLPVGLLVFVTAVGLLVMEHGLRRFKTHHPPSVTMAQLQAYLSTVPSTYAQGMADGRTRTVFPERFLAHNLRLSTSDRSIRSLNGLTDDSSFSCDIKVTLIKDQRHATRKVC